MRKSVTAMLLVVVMLFSVYYAAAETPRETIDRLDRISAIINNGLRTYPHFFDGMDNVTEVETSLPANLKTDENVIVATMAKTFLLTGTVTGFENDFIWNVDFDGMPSQILTFCYDDGTLHFKEGATYPKRGDKANFFVTYVLYNTDTGICSFLLDVSDKSIAKAKPEGY